MKIYSPNIHVFAFQLYQGPNLDTNIDEKDLNFIWESGDRIVRETLKQDLQISQRIEVDKHQQFYKVDILKDAEIIDDNYGVDFAGKITANSHQDIFVKGFVYPCRISDSYGLWLNLRRPEKENNQNTEELETDFLKLFNPNNCLIFTEHPLFIGETILITGWINNSQNQKDKREIADECLKQIFTETSKTPPPRFYHQGKLFGSPIFEYGLANQSQKYQQVLIWLFTDAETDEKFNQCYSELLDLFFYHNKIVKAYRDSRIIYKKLDAASRNIESEINKISASENTQSVTSEYLQKLQNQLKEFPQLALEYTRLLLNLEDYQNTIAINRDNYSNKLEEIASNLTKNNLQNEDLEFLKTFLHKNCITFQQQIQGDLGYFQNGLQLLYQSINSIRGIVEIEQTERDRSLERTIQMLGIGFGGGAIASGVIVQHIDKINQPVTFISPNHPPHPFYASLILSVLATFLFILLGWGITRSNSSHKSKP